MSYVFLYPLLRQNQQNIKLIYDMMGNDKKENKTKLCLATPYYIVDRDIKIHNEMKRFNYYRYIIPMPFPYQLRYESELLKKTVVKEVHKESDALMNIKRIDINKKNWYENNSYFWMSFIF